MHRYCRGSGVGFEIDVKHMDNAETNNTNLYSPRFLKIYFSAGRG